MSATSVCGTCGHANPPGRAFCSQCGTALGAAPPCPACGASNDPGARFCGQCGRPLAPAAPTGSPPLGREVRRLRGHRVAVTAVAFSPDGRRVLSGDQDGGLRIWDRETGAVLHHLVGHRDEVLTVAFSPDGRYALSGGGALDKTIRLWDAGTGEETSRLAGHTGGVTSAVFTPDGRGILSGSQDHSVRLWDADAGFLLRNRTNHRRDVVAVSLSADGSRAVSAGLDATMCVWAMEDLSEIRRLRMEAQYEDMVTDAVLAPDGLSVISSDLVAGVHLWDVARAAVVRDFEGHTGNVFAVALSPDGSLALSGAGTDFYDADLRRELGIDNTVRLWRVDTGAELARMEGHDGNVNAVAFSPDGRLGVSGSSDATVRVWRLME